ncbi:MAG: 16S rRNA (guanine(527)-N(7))-methyltransferase RsmG [Alphaproteobacteria bacterium]|nr:16S rRNA (guanine(527)-N(7))-methyltransferase RsmG [Alphaproteobacteria bacterium]
MKQLENQILPAKDLLKRYEALVLKWQKAVNLVSNKEVSSLWSRHILDSAQLYFLISNDKRVLVDLGSGGGFPAVVIAILNKVLNGPLEKVVLIESDNKKSIFLKEVSRLLDLNLTVLNQRIEDVDTIKADVITSRALGQVDLLLRLSQQFYTKETVFLLLKGQNVDEEISKLSYTCKCEKQKSLISDTGCILTITEVVY